MPMFPILFQVTAHENLEFLKIQLSNILRFNNKCAVLVHIAQQMNITDNDIVTLSRIPNVFINPIRIRTVPFKVLTQIITNSLFSLGFDYEYTCLLASNCMFFDNGAYDYMKNYDYGCYAFENHDYSGKSADCYRYKRTIDSDDGIPNYSGQHEGVFMRKELVKPLIDSFTSFYPVEKWNDMADTTEESFLPTGMNIIFRGLKKGLPICLHRDRMEQTEIGTDGEHDAPKTITYLKKLIADRDTRIQYVLPGGEVNHFYCFKRIDRNVRGVLYRHFMLNFS